MEPLHLRLRPTASTLFRLAATFVAMGVVASVAWAAFPAARPALPIAFALGCLAGAAVALRSTGVRWSVRLDDRGALFEPRLGALVQRRMQDLALEVWPDRLVCGGVDLALAPDAFRALGAWLQPRHWVAYGTPPGRVRYVPRTAVYGPTAERSPVPFVSNISWTRRRDARPAALPWLVPTALRARAPGGVARSPAEALPADLLAHGRDLEACPADPTALRSGENVAIWPVCCGRLARHEMANPVRHEILLCIDEPQLGALELALVDPLLTREDSPGQTRLRASLERAYARALENLRGGIRPMGLDVFRCQECLRIYATFEP